MRILLISAHYPPARSGVGDYTAYLANQLAQWGHRVTVLASALRPHPDPLPRSSWVDRFGRAAPPAPSQWERAGGEGRPLQWGTSLSVGQRPHPDPLPEGEGAGRTNSAVEVLRLAGDWGWRGVDRIIRLAAEVGTDGVLLQYSPFMYDPRGAPVALARLPMRLREAGVRVVTVLHEMFVPWRASPIALGRGAIERVITALLVLGSDGSVANSAERLVWLRRWFPQRRHALVPVGSNIPVVAISAAERLAVRRRWGTADGALLLSTMNPGDPLKLGPLVLEAFAEVARLRPARLVCIGADEVAVRSLVDRCAADRRPPLDDVAWTGYLPADEVSRVLTATDLYLVPFADGASTRRTTFVAGLAHGLATVSNRGYNTAADLVAAESAVLAPLDRPEAFRAAVADLAADRERREVLGRRARRHFEAEFSWPRIADRLLMLVEAPEDRSRGSAPDVLS